MNRRTLKNTILSLLLAGVGLAAFRLSFDAQVTLSIAAGVDAGLAWLYPLIVDAAIVTGVLIRLWHPELSKKLTGYLWSAIAFWTITSVLGNAFHVLALPVDRVQLPAPIAIAVNTLPALTLFLIIHLATTTAFRAPAPAPVVVPVPRPQGRRARRSDSVEIVDFAGDVVREIPASDIPPVTDDELLRLADEEELSMSQIAERVGRSKSWVGANVKRLRDERDAEQASA